MLKRRSPWLRRGLDVVYDRGKVGIGTTGPGAKLEVYDGDIKISNDANPATLTLWGDRNDKDDDGRTDVRLEMLTDNGTYGFRWDVTNEVGANFLRLDWLNDGVWETGKVTITRFADVGIGTTSPDTRLDIADGALTLLAMTQPSSPANDSACLFVEASGTSPNRTVALKVKFQDGTVTTLASTTV